ncbi:MAG: hypothetical protein DMG10_04640 [Acidobacteria bacterium]|nr:MAG: hypothetical protein DMG10_04640 [Acidobacteriota bacterium]PYV36739.1 MAG: hypothetical protein DMG09_16455 [Acidobacteriota bacterium]
MRHGEPPFGSNAQITDYLRVTMKSTASLAPLALAQQEETGPSKNNPEIRPQSHGYTEIGFLGVSVSLWLKR